MTGEIPQLSLNRPKIAMRQWKRFFRCNRPTTRGAYRDNFMIERAVAELELNKGHQAQPKSADNLLRRIDAYGALWRG